MIGDIKGYAWITSLDDVFIGMDKDLNPDGYASIEKRLLQAPVPIIDIAVEESGLLVLTHTDKAVCLTDVRSMKSVRSWFKCDCVGDVLIPPDLDEITKMTEVFKRLHRKGGYNKIIKSMVITASIHKGKFTDDFLFQKQ